MKGGGSRVGVGVEIVRMEEGGGGGEALGVDFCGIHICVGARV